ncbi:unnamed protein product [Knipowitschia caucasica]
MAELNKKLDDANSEGLVNAMEELMAKYFREADEKAEARVNRLEKRIDSLHSTLTKHMEEIKTIRADTAKLKEHVTSAEGSIAMCVETMCKQQEKLTDMEDCASRDNFLIFNLKEGVEGQNALRYLTENLPKWFPDFADACPELMRCHRFGRLQETRNRTAGKPRRPRPLIANCLRYTDRDRILKESRKHPPEVADIQLKFAADYSEATAKRRKSCYKVMYDARVKGFQAFLLYPATIKLTKANMDYTFDEASQAENFLSTLDT